MIMRKKLSVTEPEEKKKEDAIDFDAKEIAALEMLVTEGLKQGKQPAEILKMNRDHLNQLYAMGFNFYQNGLYKDAGAIFTLLSMLDSKNVEFAQALASSRQMEKKYLQAVLVLATILRDHPDRYDLLLQQVDCLFELDDLATARQSVEAVLEGCKGDPRYTHLQNKAEARRDAIDAATRKKLVMDDKAGKVNE